MATDMERAREDELVHRCDGCGGVLEPCMDDDESLVIYECFHALHAGCAHGRDACPRCHTPRRVHDDDQPEPVDEAARPASPPDNNPDEDSALASDGVGVGDLPRGGETGDEPRRLRRCDGDRDGESPAASMSGCNVASQFGCCACSRRVAELDSSLELKTAALIETASVLQFELDRVESRLYRLEEMYGKLEQEFIRPSDPCRTKGT